MTPRIFRYVVAHDAGSAPNPDDGICTLAICKPRIRRKAAAGDWIIGFRSRMPGHVTYVMKVEEVLPFERYWSDSRFAKRKPGKTRAPDNLYRPLGDGRFEQIPNPIHGPESLAKDVTRGRRVLVSRCFWYFGQDAPPLPPSLEHLIHTHVGEAVDAHRQASDVSILERWLSEWTPGKQGEPVSPPPPLPSRRC